MQSNENKQSLKKQKIIENLKNSKFANLKGSSSLMQKLQKQRNSKDNASKHSDRVEEESRTEMLEIIDKQQKIVSQLNEENIELIYRNDLMRQNCINYNESVQDLKSQNNDLKDRNESLKKQLLISQNNCSQSLKELQVARYRIKYLSSNRNI